MKICEKSRFLIIYFLKQFIFTILDFVYLHYKKCFAYKNFILLAGSAGIAHGITIIVLPILTRIYTPSDFGILAVFGSMIAMFSALSTLQYELAIPLPKQPLRALLLFVLTVLLVCVNSIIIGVLIWLAPSLHIGSMDLFEVKPYVLLFVMGISGAGIYNAFNYWAVREKNYKIIAQTAISRNAFGSAGKIIIGLFCFGPLGLLIGEVIGQFAGLGTMTRKFFRENGNNVHDISLAGLHKVAVQYYRFPLFSTTSAFLNTIAFQIPPLVILYIYGSDVAGWYYLAYSVLVIPMSLISSSIARIFLGEIAPVIQDNPHQLNIVYHSIAKKSALISFPIVGVISLGAPVFFPYLFGASWTEAGIYCIPLALLVAFKTVFSPISILHYGGFNSWVLYFDFFRTLLVVGIFTYAYLLKMPILITLTIYSLILSLMYILNYYLNIKAMAHISRHGSLHEREINM